MLEEHECDDCGKKKLCKELFTVTNTYGDGTEEARMPSIWICFECYKKRMAEFKNTEEEIKRMFHGGDE